MSNALPNTMNNDDSMSPRTGIKGIQLIDLDSRWTDFSSASAVPELCQLQMAKNKPAYKLADCPTSERLQLVIGRAPYATSSRIQGPFHDDTKEREEGERKGMYTWVHPSPVLSRSHAIVTLDNDEVLLSDAGSQNGVWRASSPSFESFESQSPALERVESSLPVHDGDVFSLGKQVEMQGQIQYPARIQINFVY